MSDPFRITEPTCLSVSGGRTSMYMLWRVLQANGGMPDEAVATFANTGREEEATLAFVRDCAERWGVLITWVEYRAPADYELVTFETASRNGEPFEALMRHRALLPNPMTRFCTQELKIRSMARYLRDLGMVETVSEGENVAWIGIRADEQRRAAKIADKSRIPMCAAGIGAQDVGEFWRSQPFDLELPNMNGKTMHGNCDLCFLKPAAQVLSLIAEKPERATWWARMEQEIPALGRTTPDGSLFCLDRPSYARMAEIVADQNDMFAPDYEQEALACFCGD